MRATIYESVPVDPAGQNWLIDLITLATKWTVFALWLVAPFIVGLLAGLIFNRIITRRGWRTDIIPVWAIPVMLGALAYAVMPFILYVAAYGLWPRSILAGLTASLFFTWPIWLTMAPVLYLYLAYLKKRQKWLRDSTVVYLSAFALASECTLLFWLSP